MALNDLRATHTWTQSTVIVGRCAYAYTLHSMASLISFTLVFSHIFHLFVSFIIFCVSFRILLLCEHLSLFDSIDFVLVIYSRRCCFSHLYSIWHFIWFWWMAFNRNVIYLFLCNCLIEFIDRWWFFPSCCCTSAGNLFCKINWISEYERII